MDTVLSSITCQSLRAVLGSPSAPIVIDVRKPAAFAAEQRLVPGALRRPHDAVNAWASSLDRHRAVVTYCVHGHEVSQGAARELRELGFDARYLEGGFEAWVDASLPTLKRLDTLDVPGPAPSRWVTRERPKIDRIACPWLVRRFVDPLAQFLYVAADQVLDVAREKNAIPYDVPAVQFAHRGAHCSFDALLEDFELHEPALDRLATIVRGADTGRPDLTAQSAGLLAISQGLSHNFPDDHAMLEAGMPIYDALYTWCRGTDNT